MTKTDKQTYKNTHGSHKDDKGMNTEVGDVTKPQHSGSRMSNENYDRMEQSPSAEK